MGNTDIRWKQRLQNFEKSLRYLEEAMGIKKPDIIQKAGLIQFFELSFELAWNTMKDYLEDQGFTGIRSPRDTIKKAFETGLITDGRTWLQALENRNLTAHTYDEETAQKVVAEITGVYYPLLKDIFETLKKEVIRMFGLKDDDVEAIKNVLAKHKEVKSAVVFGSRAKGNYKPGSDVDIALKGVKLSNEVILSIREYLNEETLMPYHFDVLNYHTIQNEDLVQHIDRVGIEFYQRNKMSPVQD